MIQFAQPLWIAAGIVICLVLIVLSRKFSREKQERLAAFVGPKLSGQLVRNFSPRLRLMKTTLFILAVFMLFLAMARPQFGYRWVEVKRKGIDILFALDTSKSMLAADLKPDRITRAKYGILDFVATLEGDRVGLLPFAGSPFLMTPLTLDYSAFESSLSTIDTEIIPHGGTNISAVISEAEKVLSNDANHKLLILLTDGENLEGDAVAAASQAGENGMTIYTVGIGTIGGERIPLTDDQGGGFVKDGDSYVTTKLDEKTLTEIAEVTGGIYTPLGNSGEGLSRIYQEKLALIPKEELAERRQKVPLEQFGWFLGAALLLLLIEYLLPDKRPGNGSPPNGWFKKDGTKKVALLLFCILPLLPTSRTEASEGETAYTNEDFIRSAEIYTNLLDEDPANPKLHYNYGTSAYKNNLYDEAIASFSESLKGADPELQEKAYFNRGNAHYKKGEESLQANPESTIKEWEEAVKSYHATLQLNPDDNRAAENRDFVQQKIDELKKQQEKNQQQNENNQQNQDGQDQKGQDQQQNNENSPDAENTSDSAADNQQPGQDNPRDQDGGENTQNQQEQGQDEQQPGENSDKPEPASGDMEEEQVAADEREEGKMTREEAENLLNMMKSGEQELNFVPRKQKRDAAKDW